MTRIKITLLDLREKRVSNQNLARDSISAGADRQQLNDPELHYSPLKRTLKDKEKSSILLKPDPYPGRRQKSSPRATKWP